MSDLWTILLDLKSHHGSQPASPPSRPKWLWSLCWVVTTASLLTSWLLLPCTDLSSKQQSEWSCNKKSAHILLKTLQQVLMLLGMKRKSEQWPAEPAGSACPPWPPPSSITLPSLMLVQPDGAGLVCRPPLCLSTRCFQPGMLSPYLPAGSLLPSSPPGTCSTVSLSGSLPWPGPSNWNTPPCLLSMFS